MLKRNKFTAILAVMLTIAMIPTMAFAGTEPAAEPDSEAAASQTAEPAAGQETEPAEVSAAVSGLEAAAVSTDSVRLTWTAPDQAGYEYTVYRKAADGAYGIAGTTAQCLYIDSGLDPQTCYTYKIGISGSEAFSEEVSIVPFAAPTVKTAIYEDGIRAAWDAVPYAETYRIYRSYSQTGEKTLLKETDSLYYDDRKVKSGEDAYYFVQACAGDAATDYSVCSSDKIIRVFIETGHGIDSRGRWDSGCRWKKYQEAKLMIPIAQSMTKYMRSSGVYVDTDAYSKNNINLFKVMKIVNKHSYSYSAVVHLHCDYYKAKSGTLPLYKTSAQKKLATALNKGVHSTVKIRDRGLCKRKGLMALNQTKYCPAVLFETGSIKADNKLLRKKPKTYGKGLAKGLCNYLKVEFAD